MTTDTGGKTGFSPGNQIREKVIFPALVEIADTMNDITRDASAQLETVQVQVFKVYEVAQFWRDTSTQLGACKHLYLSRERMQNIVEA